MNITDYQPLGGWAQVWVIAGVVFVFLVVAATALYWIEPNAEDDGEDDGEEWRDGGNLV